MDGQLRELIETAYGDENYLKVLWDLLRQMEGVDDAVQLVFEYRCKAAEC